MLCFTKIEPAFASVFVLVFGSTIAASGDAQAQDTPHDAALLLVNLQETRTRV
jgi:hypothetical protein